jgi:hypothetical protein
MAEQEITRFTDTLSGAVDKLYRTGGFALAFGFAGIIMMLGARLFGQADSQWLIILGAVLTFSCLAFFLYTTITGNKKASKAISDNKEAIDAVQDISIQLTRLTNTLQAYSFKNLDKINKALEAAIPVLKAIPLVGAKVTEYGLDNASVISQVIVDNAEKIELIVVEVEKALIDADHAKLKGYSEELSEVVKNLRQQLKK